MRLRLSLLLLLTALPTLSLSAPTQPKPTTLRSLLLHELRTTHTKAEWFVTINTAVEGLTAEQANWQPQNGGHSAGQLAHHLLFWNRRNLNNFLGLKNDSFTGDNKETFDKFDPKQWADIVSQLDRVMTDLELLVERADDQQLAKWADTIGNLCTHTRIMWARLCTCASCKAPGIRTRA